MIGAAHVALIVALVAAFSVPAAAAAPFNASQCAPNANAAPYRLPYHNRCSGSWSAPQGYKVCVLLRTETTDQLRFAHSALGSLVLRAPHTLHTFLINTAHVTDAAYVAHTEAYLQELADYHVCDRSGMLRPQPITVLPLANFSLSSEQLTKLDRNHLLRSAVLTDLALREMYDYVRWYSHRDCNYFVIGEGNTLFGREYFTHMDTHMARGVKLVSADTVHHSRGIRCAPRADLAHCIAIRSDLPQDCTDPVKGFARLKCHAFGSEFIRQLKLASPPFTKDESGWEVAREVLESEDAARFNWAHPEQIFLTKIVKGGASHAVTECLIVY